MRPLLTSLLAALALAACSQPEQARTAAASAPRPAPAPAPAVGNGRPAVAVTSVHRTRAAEIAAALGGAANVVRVDAVAITRLRVELRDARQVVDSSLLAAGATGVMRISDSVVHVVMGDEAESYAAAMQGDGASARAR